MSLTALADASRSCVCDKVKKPPAVSKRRGSRTPKVQYAAPLNGNGTGSAPCQDGIATAAGDATTGCADPSWCCVPWPKHRTAGWPRPVAPRHPHPPKPHPKRHHRMGHFLLCAPLMATPQAHLGAGATPHTWGINAADSTAREGQCQLTRSPLRGKTPCHGNARGMPT